MLRAAEQRSRGSGERRWTSEVGGAEDVAAVMRGLGRDGEEETGEKKKEEESFCFPILPLKI